MLTFNLKYNIFNFNMYRSIFFLFYLLVLFSFLYYLVSFQYNFLRALLFEFEKNTRSFFFFFMLHLQRIRDVK